MKNIYAVSDFEKDKFDCTSINLNLNGLDINTIPDTLRNLLQAQGQTEGGDTSTSNYDNRKNFSFVCLNNNDNEFTVIAPTPIDLDLAVANFESNNTSILLGNGKGTFDPADPATVGVGIFPSSVAIGDFNGDRVQDLAVANSGSNNTSILLGKGNGNFVPATPANVAVGFGPASVAIGDFNGDRVQDLAVANSGSNNASILLGKGNGTFDPAVNFGVGISPFSVAIGDFNGDRVQDLVTANVGSGSVSILLGKGNGTFDPAINVGIGAQPFSVAIGDFNGDRVQDLVTANFFSSTVSILLGNGNGTFVPANPPTVPVGLAPLSVAVGNFNSDTMQDLAVVNTGDTSNDVSILLGNGNGTFVPANPPTVPVGIAPQSVAIGDFNHDSVQDLAVVNFLSNDVSILLGNGNGTFSLAVNFAVGTGPTSVAVGNFD